MKIENIEIKNARVKITAFDSPYGGCEICNDELGEYAVSVRGENIFLQGTVIVGATCGQLYVRNIRHES